MLGEKYKCNLCAMQLMSFYCFVSRDLEMHRSPSVNSVLSNGAAFQELASPTSTAAAGFSSLSGGRNKEKSGFEDVHELLEEPVEEQVGQNRKNFNGSLKRPYQCNL